MSFFVFIFSLSLRRRSALFVWFWDRNLVPPEKYGAALKPEIKFLELELGSVGGGNSDHSFAGCALDMHDYSAPIPHLDPVEGVV